MKKTKRRQRKENRKMALEPKRTIYDSSFNCLMFSMEYSEDGKKNFPITSNPITSGIS